MKVFMPIALVLSASLFVGCTHDTANTDKSSTDATAAQTSEPSAKEGWENVKSGTKEAASGAGEIAKDAGTTVVEGTKDAGAAVKEGAEEAGEKIKSTACPVLGNKSTKVYYTKDSKNYSTLLSGKKAIATENRECFMSEANAREAGFKSSAK